MQVIVTTNFDPLLETALRELNVNPMVIATADAVKVHGDYLDARIRNTPEELTAYDARVDSLLDRIFAEYGLVICGWSGQWDEALRDAISRCPAHRYTTYWCSRRPLDGLAGELAQLRRAARIEIEDANSFFVAPEEKVRALEDVDRLHPLSTALAVATLKRYLPEERHRIRLHDLIADAVARVETATTRRSISHGGTGADL